MKIWICIVKHPYLILVIYFLALLENIANEKYLKREIKSWKIMIKLLGWRILMMFQGRWCTTLTEEQSNPEQEILNVMNYALSSPLTDKGNTSPHPFSIEFRYIIMALVMMWRHGFTYTMSWQIRIHSNTLHQSRGITSHHVLVMLRHHPSQIITTKRHFKTHHHRRQSYPFSQNITLITSSQTKPSP